MINFRLRDQKMSNLDIINSSIEMNLFLNELTLRWPIVIFFGFSNLLFFTSEKGEPAISGGIEVN